MHHTQVRMLFSHVPVSVSVAAVLATLMAVLLAPSVPGWQLWPWLALKWLLALPRIGHAVAYLRSTRRDAAHWWPVMLGLLAADSLVWGGAVWWLTPPDRTDLAAVTVSCVLGIASVGSFLLAVERRTVAAYLLPMMLPNVAWSLARGDAYGLFAAMCFTGFVGVLLMETRRSQRRIVELLRLRYTHEAALRQAEQHSAAKSRFLAAMSHEMRTPLHGVLGLARLLREDETRPTAAHRLDLLQRSGDHLLALIDDVLDFSRIEAGPLRVSHAPFALDALVDEVAAVTAVQAARKGLLVRTDFQLPRPCSALGDAARLRQVLHNLLGNAVKFCEHGEIVLSVRGSAQAAEVHFAVSDCGIGIPAEELDRIFEPFHQVDAALDRRHPGTGLGLAISRELCRAMGGELVCESEPGQGATFRFSLPLQPRPDEAPPHHPAPAAADRAADAPVTAAAPVRCAQPVPQADSSADPRVDHPPATAQRSPGPDPHAPRPRARRPGRVLLVEDNPVNALVAEATLAQLGVADVVTLTDGRQAVDWLATHPADLVLMDCQMPVMDGLEATRRIRQAESASGRSRVPVVALTAQALVEERQRCTDAGMDDHLSKPFRIEALQAVLDRHLGAAPAPAATALERPACPAG
jgi:signal transduction histidine kinase/ActR/RegA family two-component response regulator